MKKIDVYDFDKTLYSKDSSVEFFKFCLSKNKKIIKYTPGIIFLYILYFIKIIKKEKLKEYYFKFLKEFNNTKELVKEFWSIEEKNIRKNLIEENGNEKVVISASPKFLIKDICEKVGINKIIASEVNIKTRKFESLNCHGKEKLNRLNKEIKNYEIDNFYSDSYSDEALAKESKNAFIVDSNRNISNWIFQTKKEKYLKKIISLIFIFSLPVLTLLLSNCYKHGIIPTCFLSFIISIILVLLFKNKKIKFNKKILIISTIFSFSFIKQELKYTYLNNNEYIMWKLLRKIGLNFNASKTIGICALPATILLIYFFIIYFLPKIKLFFKSLKNVEKKYLIIISIISLIMAFYITRYTTAFTVPKYDNSTFAAFDVIYTSDSRALTDNLNTYFNPCWIENDIRQPLFGILSLPFSIPINFLSNLSFLSDSQTSFAFLMIITQFILLAITNILLSRLLDLSEKESTYFYIFISLTFPYLLFSLILEQYVFSLFYLILMIYIYFVKKRERDLSPNYYYVGAVGSLLTSGVLFPMISTRKNIKDKIIDIFKCFLVFCAFVIIGGQLPQIFTLQERLTFLKTFNTNVGIYNKIYQFTNFISGIFFANPGHVIQYMNFKAYRLFNYTSINIIGVIILILCIISFILNRKNKINLISLLWIIFSFIILFIIGWGTTENGLILYSLYFGWAYIILIFNLFRKIEDKKVIFNILFIILIIIMICINFKELFKIIDFAKKFYWVP